MLKLKNSGYNCKFRNKSLDSGLKAFEQMTEDDKKGIKPMYRGKEWNADERKRSKSKKNLTGGIVRKQKSNTKLYCLRHQPLVES